MCLRPCLFQGSGPHGRCTWRRSISLTRQVRIKWVTEQTLGVAPGTCWTPQRLGPGDEGCRRQGLRGKGRHDVTAVPVGELARGFVKTAQRWGCGWRPVAGRDASQKDCFLKMPVPVFRNLYYTPQSCFLFKMDRVFDSEVHKL